MKYAAITTRSIYVPGDERSRTAPGHGYPEHYEEAIDLIEFKNRSEMETWVKCRIDRGERVDYRLIEYNELSIETTVSVKVK